jgi:predicted RNase H-like HicB family nuclease
MQLKNISGKLFKVDSTTDAGMKQKFNVIVEEGQDGFLISDVVELPGCHTQAKTYDELMKRTKEAIKLCLLEKNPTESRVKFVSLQQLEIEV